MKIRSESVTAQVVSYLRERITSGDWAVGEPIPSETRLVSELGVSRASVRSAIQYFIALGALKSRQGKGTYLVDTVVDEDEAQAEKITAEDCQDIVKVLEFRAMLEPAACRAAVERNGASLPPRLEEALETMRESHAEGDADRFVEADLDFHARLCAGAENPLADKSLRQVFREHLRNHRQLNALFGDEAGIRYHSDILDAVRRQDANEAAGLLERHLRETMESVRGMMNQ